MSSDHLMDCDVYLDRGDENSRCTMLSHHHMNLLQLLRLLHYDHLQKCERYRVRLERSKVVITFCPVAHIHVDKR